MTATTPLQVARVLVGAEYPRDHIERAMRQHFSDAQIAPALEQAYREKERFDRELDEQVAADERAAREAEHDLGTSMHRERGDE